MTRRKDNTWGMEGVLSMAVCIFCFVILPGTALAAGNTPEEILGINPGFGPVAGDTFEGIPGESGFSLVGVIRYIVNIFLAIVGIVAVIVIIIAGFRLIVSGGDEDALRTSRQQILYAIIGLLIILLSTVIVNFVFSLFPTS